MGLSRHQLRYVRSIADDEERAGHVYSATLLRLLVDDYEQMFLELDSTRHMAAAVFCGGGIPEVVPELSLIDAEVA